MKVLNGLKYRQSWKLIPRSYGRSMKWRQQAVNRMLLAMIQRPTNTFFTIARRKVRKVGEAFAMIMQRMRPGKNLNPKILPLMGVLLWALRFYLKNNTVVYRNLESLI